MDGSFVPTVGSLWQAALTAVPVVFLVALTCRVFRCRPVTKHSLWLTALLWFVISPLLPAGPFGGATNQDAAQDATQIVAAVGQAVPSLKPALLAKRPALELPAQPRTAALNADATQSALQRESIIPDRSKTGSGPTTPSRRSERSSGRAYERRTIRSRSIPRSQVAPAHNPRGAVAIGTRPSRAAEPVHHRDEAEADPPMSRSTTEPFAALSVRPSGLRAASAPRKLPPAILDTPPLEASKATPARAVESAADNGRTAPWTKWLMALSAVWLAVSALPPIPLSLWFIGGAVLGSGVVIRIVRYRLHLRSAQPASDAVEDMIAGIASELGLAKAPEAVMVDRAVSPMVWCGWQARIILPSPLWQQLDETGRRAILCHELAHLRRRDHWIRWMELLISAFYWWHPAVWWIRHRLHEEADLCCDLWVTWLMPQDRRAYAKALLHTNQYLNQNNSPMPAVGIGAVTGRARSFARRLTMVMTQNSRPGFTLAAILPSIGLLLIGWMATPAQSCPPKSKEKGEVKCSVSSPEKAHAPDVAFFPGELATVVGTAPSAPASFAPHVGLRHSYAQVAPRALVLVTDDVDDIEDRISRVEAQLARLIDLLDGKAAKSSKASKQKKARKKSKGRSWVSPTNREPRDLRKPRAPRAVREPRAPRPPVRSFGTGQSWATRDTAETTPRSYVMSRGKLEALSALMIRDDVPVLVSPGEDDITIHATPKQHHEFDSFMMLVGPENQTRSYHLPEGKLEGLVNLLGRGDVTIFISQDSAGIVVNGTEEELDTIGEFIHMIHPNTDAGGEPAPSPEMGSSQRANGRDAYASILQEQADSVREQEYSVLKRIGGHGKKEAVLRQYLEATRADEARSLYHEAQNRAAEVESRIQSEMKARVEVGAAAAARYQAEARAMRERMHEVQNTFNRRGGEGRNRFRDVQQQMRELERQLERLKRQSSRLNDQAQQLRDRATRFSEQSMTADPAWNVEVYEVQTAEIELALADIEDVREVLVSDSDQLELEIESILEEADELIEVAVEAAEEEALEEAELAEIAAREADEAADEEDEQAAEQDDEADEDEEDLDSVTVARSDEADDSADSSTAALIDGDTTPAIGANGPEVLISLLNGFAGTKPNEVINNRHPE